MMMSDYRAYFKGVFFVITDIYEDPARDRGAKLFLVFGSRGIVFLFRCLYPDIVQYSRRNNNIWIGTFGTKQNFRVFQNFFGVLYPSFVFTEIFFELFDKDD